MSDGTKRVLCVGKLVREPEGSDLADVTLAYEGLRIRDYERLPAEWIALYDPVAGRTMLLRTAFELIDFSIARYEEKRRP